MSSYEVEHNIAAQKQPSDRPRRPDLSTFFSTLDTVDTSGERQPSNVHSLPQPGDVSAAYRTLAHAFEMMRVNGRTVNGSGEGAEGGIDVLEFLIDNLMQGAEAPPREVEGVPDSFLTELERVPKKSLKAQDSCPICSNPFLDDEFPLVVRLPCHKDHLFDLDCIGPWLKLNPTCPLDRQVLLKKKEPQPVTKEDEVDGEWDDMFA
ncbi:hypothetical protein B0A49_01092 [Cryomyces minteri]|uniref:RING-type domain-containing protein n=1 Tax=Cryomyces minteri TaxID=331657 RepID=A0A4U0XSS7_9PEZI|nr:hypothetical protein B0A49_01092 [Cryomyces minteri]